MKAILNAPAAKTTNKAPTYPRLVEGIAGSPGFSDVFLLLHDRKGSLGAPERNNAIRLRDGTMATITTMWYQDYKGSVTIEND